ncbi:MAG TPA: threonine synthase [Symbiobacteriaceae bacterium]|jgi:threonine synthase
MTIVGQALTELICSECGVHYPFAATTWRCACGGPLDIPIAPNFRPEALAGRQPGLWRYREALPAIPATLEVSLGEPMTPLVPARPGSGLTYKLDFLMPSGSYKDRGTTVVVSTLRHLGAARIVEDSSGNAGASMAAYCSAASIPCEIYAPADASPGKTRQVRCHGARLVLVDGTREDVALAAQATVSTGAVYASHAWSPLFLMGTATLAYELWEQMGGQVPDNIIVPAGSGTLVLGAYRGFDLLRRSGVTDRMPRIFAVQATGCAPLYHAEQLGSPTVEGFDYPIADTVAEGIRIRRPARGRQILSALRETGGAAVAVSEEEIRTGWADLLGRGLFAEPTSAVVAAGAGRLLRAGRIAGGERTVAVLSGHGLKSTALSV